MSTAPDATVAVNEQPLSEPQRLIDVFIAPSKTFTDIRRTGRWWVPFLVMILFGLPFQYLIGEKVGWENIMRVQQRFQPEFVKQRLEQLTPEQRAQADEQGLKQTKFITRYIYVLVLVGLTIYSLILQLSINFGLGAELKFWQTMAVVFYAHLVYIVRSILAAVVLLIGVDPGTYNIRTPVGTMLAYYLPIDETSKALYAFATRIDVIEFWVLALLIIGFSAVTGKKKGSIAMVVLGWWTLVTLISVGFAAM
jgi:hypothetical protein